MDWVQQGSVGFAQGDQRAGVAVHPQLLVVRLALEQRVHLPVDRGVALGQAPQEALQLLDHPDQDPGSAPATELR